MTYHQRNPRRGVTLLLVLGLMTMFAMLVVTFMVVTTQALKTSQITAEMAVEYKGKSAGTPLSSTLTLPDPKFDDVLNRLLVGGLGTVIGPHSILENLYGHPNFEKPGGMTLNLEGTVNGTPTTYDDADGNPICIQFTLDLNTGNDVDYGDYGDSSDLLGGVLTVKEDNNLLDGKSTVIVGADLSGGNTVLYIAPFKDVSSTDQVSALSGAACIVNTPAFGGTGPGYVYNNDPTKALLTDGDGDFAWALRPNVLAPESNGDQPYKTYLEDNLVLMNPDYTAPDYQNMFLAWADVRESAGGDPLYQVEHVIPSFHRPQLVNYWNSQSKLGSAENLRKIVLRPLRQDHPDFTGGNVAAAASLSDEINFLINGPWDVDNDGDGIQDGIWLDLGSEPVTIGDKKYKRLYSFYVLDMDGRLNVNVHGNRDHYEKTDFDTVTLSSDETKNGSVAVRGAGSGVAEVRLDLGLNVVNSDLDETKVKDLIEGAASKRGRCGADTMPGNTAWNDGSLTDSVSTDDFPWRMGLWHGAYGALESTSTYKGFGGIVPDFWGYAPMLFDPLGNRKFDDANFDSYFSENPYLFNPYGDENNITNGIDDEPFGFNDLEFVLRSVCDKNFQEVLLSDARLRYLLDDKPEEAHKFSKLRHFVTTRSSDIPVAGRAGLNGHLGLFDYIKSQGFDEDKIRELLPPELLRGERVNLNRIMLLEASFNSGSISTTEELLKQKAKFAQEIFYLMMLLFYEKISDGYTDGDLTKEDMIARIAQWSVNLVDFLDADDVMTPLVYHETNPLNNPYNFADDFSSFLGSSYSPPTDCRLIWGMEQPEVALTKTFATHNRRVADSKYGDDSGIDSSMFNRDTTHKDACTNCTCQECKNAATSCEIHLKRMGSECDCNCTTGNHVHDGSFDQVMVPQGSLFLELYRLGNPDRKDYPKNNGSDYVNNVRDTESGENTLDLGKMNGNSPIWRLAIGKAAKKKPGTTPETGKNDIFNAVEDKGRTYDFQPQQWPDDAAKESCEVELERFIWFGNTEPTVHDKVKDRSYWNFGSPDNDTSGNNVKLRPNEYLVIGPRVFTSFASKEVDDENGPDKEFGVPDGNSNDEGINEYSINLKKLAEKKKEDDKRCKFMIAAAESLDENYCVLGGDLKKGIGVSVSEPLPSESKYYKFPTTVDDDMKASTEMKNLMGGADYYDKFIGDELCNKPWEPNSVDEQFKPGFGTLTCYKSIFLQRLADPNREHDPVSNPYVTVDWNMIDLHVFNSERDKNGRACIPDDSNTGDPAMEYPATAGAMNGLYFSMRQWGYTATKNTAGQRPNIWDRSFDESKFDDDEAGLAAGKSEPKVENKETNFALGSLNIEGATAQDTGDEYDGTPTEAFLHFPWNDGPLANTYELMMVPACSPSRFGFEFHERANTNEWWKNAPSLGGDKMPISNELYKIGPYFNFLYQEDNSLHLAKLFDFVRVPSRFNGTVRGVYTDNADKVIKPVYEMREPGKINLNTANLAAWEALRSQSESDTHQTRYEQLNVVRGFDPGNPPTDSPSEFPKPFRSAQAGALVPLDNLVQTGVEATVLRNDSAGNPLFKPMTGSMGEVNQFTLLENVMRRGDMVTNRSNVFAVWVTVGYFEVQQYDSFTAFSADHSSLSHVTATNFGAIYPHGCVLGKEKGIEDGSVTRHRGFYIIDRTVPVGFRRGEQLNSQKVIIHSQRLE